MSESEDPGSSSGEGRQEQNGVLQSKYDGGLSAGLGKLTQMCNLTRRLIGNAAQRQIGQE